MRAYAIVLELRSELRFPRMQCRRGGMVDTIDSKSIAREGVRVQVSSPVKKKVTDTSAKKTPRNRCGVFNF